MPPSISDTELEVARLAAIVSSSDDAIISKTLDGVITSWNAAATHILGYQPDEIIGQPITRIIPPHLQSEEEMIIGKVRRGERTEHFDTLRLRKDGTLVPLSITVSPVRDAAGRIVGASKVARDITERRKHEQQQRTQFDELNHRVKNILATVQALASQSLRGKLTVPEARSILLGRLKALSKSHDQLSHNAWRSAPLEAVVEQTLRPFGNRIACSGPAVQLNSQEAVSWGMVVHELATNAAKYGALSQPAGHVQASWKLSDQRDLEFDWMETGGPATVAPARKGFGTTFIERAVDQALGGLAQFDYRPGGLQVHLMARLS